MRNIRNYIYIFILMILVLVVALINSKGKVEKDDNKIKVALIENKGFSVTSENPVVIDKGEQAQFDIVINDNYYYVENEGVKYENGKVIFDDITSSKNIYLDLGYNCLITVADGVNGTVELIGENRVPQGEKSSIKIQANEHYGVECILINGKEYPPISGDVFEFAVEDDCNVEVKFIGEPVNFMYMSNNLGTVTVGNQVDEYHYGDVINLDCVFPENINFNGWSVEGYIDDGGTVVVKDSKWDYTITEDTILYANFKDTSIYNITFNANEGSIASSIDMESSPRVNINLPVDDGSIIRDGYTLVGYNTAADGSGENYQLGEMIVMPEKNMELYAMWIKNTDVAYLDYAVNNGGIVINGLKGNYGELTELCIPAKINGNRVVSVGNYAFSDIDTIKTVVVPVGLQTIGQGAFANCDNLQTVYLPETLTDLAGNAFSNSENFSNLRVLASLGRAFDYDYDSILADKYMKLKNSTGNRIIIVGGSNLTFGLNSVMIQERFPDYDVINFSGSFMYGMVTLFELVKANTHEGDIVIFCPEYYSSTYGSSESYTITNWQYIESNYAMLEDVDIRNTPIMFSQYVSYLSTKRGILPGKLKNSDSVYVRSGINSYGDLTVFRKNKTGKSMVLPTVGIITDAGMNRYNAVCKELSENGVTCLFSFPPIHGGESDREYIDTATKAFMDKLNESLDSRYCTVISKCSDYSFDVSLFYDNIYHLTLDGAKERTKVLIKDLEAFGLE